LSTPERKTAQPFWHSCGDRWNPDSTAEVVREDLSAPKPGAVRGERFGKLQGTSSLCGGDGGILVVYRASGVAMQTPEQLLMED
jgi:hypothetical protein